MRRILSKSLPLTVAVVVAGLWLARDWGPQSVLVGFLRPFAAGWAGLERGGGRILGLLTGATADELEDLHARVAMLELRLARARDAERDNTELRALLGLPAAPDWQVLIARVVARDPVQWNRRFRIDRGTQAGVRPGAVVLAGGFVAGRVLSCDRASALVTTLLDPACRLSVEAEGDGACGLLVGRGEPRGGAADLCTVEYLPRDLPDEPGRLFLTSGLGIDTPGALPVGRAVAGAGGRTAEPVNGIHARVKIKPLADWRRIGYVAVVCRRPGEPGPETAGDEPRQR